MRTIHRRVRLAAAGAVLASPLLFSGCGELFEKAAEEAIENSGECENAEIDVDDDNGGSASFNCDGDEFAAGGDIELPDDFPTADVPLVDGTVIAALSGPGRGAAGDDGWTVTMQTEQGAKGAFDAAVSALEGAGYGRDETTFVAPDEATEAGGSATMTKRGYVVNVLVGATGSNATVIYSVSKG